MSTPETGHRLMRPAAGSRQRHLTASVLVVVISALGLAGIPVPLIAFLAAGAGAGYSLSGSV